MRFIQTVCLAVLVIAGGSRPAAGVLIATNNYECEDFQAAGATTPAPGGGTGNTSPLDATWDYSNDTYSATHIANPSSNDYLQSGAVTLSLVTGALHGASQPLSALADGLIQQNSDQTARSVFGDGALYRVRIAFPELRLVERVNSYSWHTSTRTVQAYNLYASAAAVAPSGVGDLAANGWTLVASVDSAVLTLGVSGAGSRTENSKHGVSINVGGVPYQYLLIEVLPTFNSGVFLGEIDVTASAIPKGTLVSVR
jgi:hypothetical protein